MAETLVAHASLTFNAPRAQVWDALVTAETIKQWLFDNATQREFEHAARRWRLGLNNLKSLLEGTRSG